MSTRTIVRAFLIATALLLIGATWQVSHSQAADSTVCVSFRTRTTSTGKISTTSVAKVPCGAGVAPKPDTVVVTKRDTLNQFWALTITNGRGVYGLASSIGVKPVNFTIPTGGRDTVVWYPNITPTGDSLFYTLLAWRVGIQPSGFRFPGGTTVVRVDTVRIPGPVVRVVDTVYLPAPTPPTGEVRAVPDGPWRFKVFRGTEDIGQIAPTGNISIQPWTQWAAWRKGNTASATGFCMNDAGYPTKEAALAAVAAPYTGKDLCAPISNPPALPCCMKEMDDMIREARAADTLPRTKATAPRKPAKKAVKPKKMPVFTKEIVGG